MGRLDRCRVVVVEDEAVIALELDFALSSAGGQVIGPFSSVSSALDAIRQEAPDAAVLDVTLGGETAYPVADALRAAGVPFVWVTSYSEDALPERHRSAPLVCKPFGSESLIGAVASVLPSKGSRRKPRRR
jgi:two-component SAPR family response regulator